MCGIAGYVNFDFSEPDAALLQKMMSTIALRGPDGRGTYIHDNTGLAHTRLSIIDVDGGAQPLSNEDGTIWVVFNGEIFNYRGLRQQLLDKGHVFRTASDTEVIVHLYEEYGSTFVSFLDGFFAFALYDTKQKVMFLARDRMGIKPLYYYNSSSHYAFASTIGALKQLPFVEQTIAPQAIWDYLSLQYVPGGTVYSQISQIEPGHMVMFHTGSPIRQFRDEAYWTPDFSHKKEKSYADACEELREAMRRSVAKRLISDVPLGVFLSGGLDSTIVAGLAAQQINAPLQCFSIGFEDPSYDESGYARQNAEHIRRFARYGFEHHVKTVDPCDFETLVFLVKQYGEPFADASMLPTYFLSRFAREHVKVALSGDGADELFGGYERYLAMRYLARFDCLGEPLRRPLFHLLAAMIPNIGNERQKWARAKRFLRCAAFSDAERYLGILSHADETMKRRIAGCVFDHVSPTLETFRTTCYDNAVSDDPPERASQADIAGYLREDILKKVDVASMSASLEVRSPFLDCNVAGIAFRSPYEFKEQNGIRKRILADTFAEYLPPGLASRRKRGFGVPVAAWFRKEWKELLRERLLDGQCVKQDFFRRSGLEKVIKEHTGGKADHSYLLYSSLILELFLD